MSNTPNSKVMNKNCLILVLTTARAPAQLRAVLRDARINHRGVSLGMPLRMLQEYAATLRAAAGGGGDEGDGDEDGDADESGGADGDRDEDEESSDYDSESSGEMRMAATPALRPVLAPTTRLRNTKGYSSTYLAMGFANVRAGTQKTPCACAPAPAALELCLWHH